jgi:murein DD-endopeptidase MepM/ murein hydrolase activator NlpD
VAPVPDRAPLRTALQAALSAFPLVLLLYIGHATAEAGVKPAPKVAPTPLTSWVYPVLGPRLSSEYGRRSHPLRKVVRHHHGVDLAAPVGAQVRAVAAGTVIYADPYGGYGKFVVVRHAHDLTSHYGHCDSISVSPGQYVRAGQVIARVGNSGQSTGPHLHLELRHNGVPRNPEHILPGITE